MKTIINFAFFVVVIGWILFAIGILQIPIWFGYTVYLNRHQGFPNVNIFLSFMAINLKTSFNVLLIYVKYFVVILFENIFSDDNCCFQTIEKLFATLSQ